MLVGFDYGSANCAVGVMKEGEVELLKLTETSNYLTSTLYAMDRDLIAEAVLNSLAPTQQAQYRQLRASQLSRARQARHELDLDPSEQAVFVGEQAVSHYLDMPEEGFYVRSPKSFLGATGLRVDQIALFEDIVTLMMMHVKKLAEAQTQQALTHAVIGRPVNFQGLGGEESNRQAEAILTTAAQRAGFSQVSFLFEPLAAGMDFEASLVTDNTVLVVDVGGGTTDCSVVRMGPSHQGLTERSQDFLGHSGQRIGGNDLDIALAMQGLMPELGLGSKMVNGLDVPSKPYWNAVAVNDISAQRDFSTLSSRKMIEEVIKDAKRPELLNHLLQVQKNQLGYQIVRQAEAAKIALSDESHTQVPLDFIAPELAALVSRELFESAINTSVTKVESLMALALEKAQTTPDIIYVTGGTARSPAIYNKIATAYPGTEIVVGDHFGSVTSGLTRWAQKCFS